MTITIQIGNSDDKLPQAQWACFFDQVAEEILASKLPVHFSASSAGHHTWQNACWVVQCDEFAYVTANTLKAKLIKIRGHYNQDSIAWTEGVTKFV